MSAKLGMQAASCQIDQSGDAMGCLEVVVLLQMRRFFYTFAINIFPPSFSIETTPIPL